MDPTETNPPAHVPTQEEIDRDLRDLCRMKASRFIEAAALIEEFKPKAAAALWGDGHAAMVEWSKMGED